MCELIKSLAEILDDSSIPRTDVQQSAIEHLKCMSGYLTRQRLDKWESDFPWESIEDNSLAGTLIEHVFELGRFNLYGEFDIWNTLRDYEDVKAMYLDSGLTPQHVPFITGW